MPTIARQVSAATDDALSGLKFKTQGSPALVTLAANTETAGETCSFSVGNQEYLSQGFLNVETGDLVDMQRDILLQQEAVPPGEYFLAFPAATGTINFVLIIEPVPQ